MTPPLAHGCTVLGIETSCDETAAALVMGGGGAERNWRPLPSTNGVTEPQLVNTGGAKAGGVGR